MTNYILYLSTTNCIIITRIEKSRKNSVQQRQWKSPLSLMTSTSKKEATLSLIPKSCFFSNLLSLLSRMSYQEVGVKRSKANHVVYNIKPTFISRSLLHALYKMIYTVRSNIFGEIMKDRMRAVRDIPENRLRVSIWFLEDGGQLERRRNHYIWHYGSLRKKRPIVTGIISLI